MAGHNSAEHHSEEHQIDHFQPTTQARTHPRVLACERRFRASSHAFIESTREQIISIQMQVIFRLFPQIE
jgi:hypothetical protein